MVHIKSPKDLFDLETEWYVPNILASPPLTVREIIEHVDLVLGGDILTFFQTNTYAKDNKDLYKNIFLEFDVSLMSSVKLIQREFMLPNVWAYIKVLKSYGQVEVARKALSEILPNQKYRIVDGHHRCLIYATLLSQGKIEFESVKVRIYDFF